MTFEKTFQIVLFKNVHYIEKCSSKHLFLDELYDLSSAYYRLLSKTQQTIKIMMI